MKETVIKHNYRGAGRKPLPYKTKVIRVPVHLELKIKELVKKELTDEQSRAF